MGFASLTFRWLRPCRAPVAIALLAGAVTFVAGGQPAVAAGVTLTTLTDEGFTGATTADAGWSVPSGGGNSACLTAGTNTTQTPIRACGSTRIDAPGSGTLRLTTNALSAVGTVYNTTSLPTSQGLDVRFNTYQWNSHTTPGADGIAFILAATDPSNPAPPANTGPLGGSLGYSATLSGQNGVSNGYLGFGLDVFGNFRNQSFGGTGCGGSTASAQNVTVRGPGNGTAGYCIAGTRQVSSGALDARASTTRPSAVPVEIAINPSDTATASLGGVTAPANSWLIVWTPLGGTQQSMTGALPTAATLAAYNYPASYYDPATGLPYQLTFGWAASTGGNDEIHEINTLATSTLNGQLPVFDLAVSDNQSSHFVAGNNVTVTVTPSLDASQGPESRPATVTTTFPAGLTPTNPTSPDYACTTTAQVVRCVYTPATPLTPGQALPTISIPVAVASNAAATLAITSKVSSTDANPAATTRNVTVTAFTATVGAPSVSHGTAESLIAAGLPANATGSVTFTSGATTLCTAILPAPSCAAPATLSPATYPVTASYSGDPNYSPQTTTTSFVVTKAATTFSAGVSDTSVPFGTADTVSFSGLPADATGTMTFTSGATTLCSVTVGSATSCATPANLAAGSYPVTASYSGDGNYLASTATTAYTVTRVGTSFTAGVSDPSVSFGTADTLSWSGLPGDVTGTVSFTSGAVTLCTATVPATSCSTAATLPPGTYPVTASYSGDTNHAGSSATTSFEVTKAATAVNAGVSDASITFGTADTLVISGLPAGSTGTVTFTSGGITLCTVDVATETSCSTPTTLNTGSYPVLASYSGDGNYLASTDTTTFTVTQQGTTSFTAAPAAPSVVYGSPDTLSFSGLPATATGTVTFVSGGVTLCTVSDIIAATSCATPDDLDVGTYPVTATYSGDANHTGSTTTSTFDVTAAATTIEAAVSDPSVIFGSPDTLSFSGLPAGATGTVTFTAGGVTLCTVTDITAATSCATPDDLDVGTYPVTADYSGAANHTGSTGTTTFEIVQSATSISAGVSDSTVPYTTANTVSFSGLPGNATGTVTFTSGGVTLCTVTDITAATSCATPDDLDVGTYPVTATYSGDANHTGSTAITTFDVVKADLSVIASVSQPSIPFGTAETLVVTGLPAGATGTVAFTSGAATLCSVDISVATTCTASAQLATGTYPVTATYSGDDHYNGSSDDTTFAVVRAGSQVIASVSDATVTYGTADTLSFSGLPADATGTVTFTSGGITLCSVDVTVGSGCTTTANLTAGDYPVAVLYSGDSAYLPSSDSTGFAVLPAPTAFTAAVGSPAVTYGSTQTLSVSGLPAYATGTITFQSDGVVLCTIDIATATSCRAPATLAVGDYPVTAAYSGDVNYQPSTATTQFAVVKLATPLTSATVHTTITAGQPVVLTLGGLPAGATGTIVFRSGPTVLCTATLPATSCVVTTSLAVGAYTITASYSGDATHASAVVSFTITISASAPPPHAGSTGHLPGPRRHRGGHHDAPAMGGRLARRRRRASRGRPGPVVRTTRATRTTPLTTGPTRSKFPRRSWGCQAGRSERAVSERATGIEPAQSVWKTETLPLSYARGSDTN